MLKFCTHDLRQTVLIPSGPKRRARTSGPSPSCPPCESHGHVVTCRNILMTARVISTEGGRGEKECAGFDLRPVLMSLLTLAFELATEFTCSRGENPIAPHCRMHLTVLPKRKPFVVCCRKPHFSHDADSQLSPGNFCSCAVQCKVLTNLPYNETASSTARQLTASHTPTRDSSEKSCSAGLVV